MLDNLALWYAIHRASTYSQTVPASPLPGWCPVAFNSLGGVTAISDPSHLWPEPRVSNSVPWSGPALNAKPKKHRLACTQPFSWNRDQRKSINGLRQFQLKSECAGDQRCQDERVGICSRLHSALSSNFYWCVCEISASVSRATRFSACQGSHFKQR